MTEYRMVECPNCEGTGDVKANDPESVFEYITCSTCDGTGEIEEEVDEDENS